MTGKSLIFIVIQLFLFLVLALVPSGYETKFAWQLAAFIMVILGIVLVAMAMFHLGPKLNPLPILQSNSKVSTIGVYKLIRHPRYTGFILICAGVSVYSMNVPRTMITLLLVIVLYYKSIYEEKLLMHNHPEYTKYKTKTGRFIPKFFKK